MERCCLRPQKLVWSFDSGHLACLMKGLEMTRCDSRILYDLSIRAARCLDVEFLQYLLPMYSIDDYQVCRLMALSRKSAACVVFLNEWLQGRRYPHLTYLCIDTLNVALYLSTYHGWDGRVGLWLASRLRFQTLDLITKVYDYRLERDETGAWLKTFFTDDDETASVNDSASNVSIARLTYYIYQPSYCVQVLHRRDFNIKMIRPYMARLSFFGALWGGPALSYLAYSKGHLNAMMFLGRHFGFSPLIPRDVLPWKYRKHLV
jgi:hypothetical protein